MASANMPTTERPERYLFICGQNKWRSPTAEALFADVEGVEAISAGTNHDAETCVSGDLIEWADVIYVMERKHAKKVKAAFADLLKSTPLHVLGIADNYPFMDERLVGVIKSKFPRWFAGN